ncbi:MAG: SusD/RagB family nutrient-binding outer membrane lipoprotein [Bacteroidales bacterium]|nr:SusD/RagB family nutrient-binding outer membrane lipoprotein [Bacteroidales bacterium]
MKKIYLVLTVFIMLASCGKLEDLNKNTKDPATVSGESLFTSAQKNLVDQMVNSNVNTNIYRLIMQYWCETTYTDESNYDLDTRTIPDNHWDILYRDVLKDLDESAKVIGNTTYLPSESPSVKKNKLAIVEIMSIYTYSVLVETFGNIPYSEALNLSKPTPVYDDGLTVYKALIERLNTAIGNLDQENGSFDIADNMFQGDVSKWYSFANSLKLRMGIAIADADAVAAKAAVESAASKVISSNSQNASMVYLSASPNYNPVYADLVASGRHDFIPTSTIVDVMNTWEDPRRAFYFTMLDGAYVGGENGASNDFTAYSHVSDRIQLATFEGTLFDYAETEFLLAEAAARGFNVGGTAEEHYNLGIRASIEYWGGTTADADTYLAKSEVAYETAAGDWKQKIGMQAWLALYNRGFEAWTSYRRLDYPQLVAPADAVSPLPLRFTYPINEQTLNGANYESASTAIGGDAVDTKLFFDKF